MLSNTSRKGYVVLGASGFVGRETVRRAAEHGEPVFAISRSTPNDASRLREANVHYVAGDAADPATWIDFARGTRAVIDLVQPTFPRRVTRAILRDAATYRSALAARVVNAIAALPSDERPVYVSVSGFAELAPDESGRVSERSRVIPRPRGFGVIGAAVGRAIVESNIPTIQIHLGSVYGPGKMFAERIVPAVRAGRFPVVGRGTNRVSLIHVADAARAITHIARMGDRATSVRWIVSDGGYVTLRDFVHETATALGAPRPKRVPRWLGALVSGHGLVDEVTKDVFADSSALTATGWRPIYSTFSVGLEATLRELGMPERRTTEADKAATPRPRTASSNSHAYATDIR